MHNGSLYPISLNTPSYPNPQINPKPQAPQQTAPSQLTMHNKTNHIYQRLPSFDFYIILERSQQTNQSGQSYYSNRMQNIHGIQVPGQLMHQKSQIMSSIYQMYITVWWHLTNYPGKPQNNWNCDYDNDDGEKASRVVSIYVIVAESEKPN